MYRSDLNTRDKSGAIAAVIAIHAGLVFMLLHLSGRVDLADPQSVLRVFDVTPPPPPPPPTPELPKPAEEAQKPKEKEGAAAPPNLKSQATPVVAPKPRVELPVKPPVAVTQTPNEGAAPTQGASVPGPGTGAGGTGTGTGSGGSGSGTGGGGEGLAATRTRLATPPLRGRDFSPQLLDAWPRGAWVYMRFRVDAAGNIIQCITDRGTGNPVIDATICDTARRRLRYRPGIDRRGNAVADWAAYGQAPPR